MADRPAEQRRAASRLLVADWPGGGPPILALHGSTSNHRFWSRLAADFPDRRIVAPDLRGHGGSGDAGGPYGIGRHAADAAELLTELDLRDVVVVGHSLGAFVGTLVAARAADRVAGLVLLDGGLPVKLPWIFLKPVVRLVFTIAGRGAARPVESGAEFAEKTWKGMLGAHAAERAIVAGWVEGGLRDTPRGRAVAIDPAAPPQDAVSCFFNPELREAAQSLSCPAHLVYAEWGRGDGAGPFYAPDYAESLARTLPVKVTRVRGVNHLTLLFSPAVVTAVAAAGR